MRPLLPSLFPTREVPRGGCSLLSRHLDPSQSLYRTARAPKLHDSLPRPAPRTRGAFPAALGLNLGELELRSSWLRGLPTRLKVQVGAVRLRRVPGAKARARSSPRPSISRGRSLCGPPGKTQAGLRHGALPCRTLQRDWRHPGRDWGREFSGGHSHLQRPCKA